MYIIRHDVYIYAGSNMYAYSSYGILDSVHHVWTTHKRDRRTKPD